MAPCRAVPSDGNAGLHPRDTLEDAGVKRTTISRVCAVALAIATFSGRPDAVARAFEPVPGAWKPGDPIPSLAEAYRGQFLIGAAVDSAMLLDGNAREFLEHQYNVIAAEAEMKPFVISKGEGQYNFAPADALVNWADKKGIKVRGHCFVWHLEEPPWMFTQDGKPVSRDLLVRRMRQYIHDVVGHFKGRVWAWDVVNEAFVPFEREEQVDGWRKSRWYDIIGPEYIPLAFQFAHEADPGALLFYNDYETQNPAKRSMILELIRSLNQKHVAIHGIGHEAHYDLGHPAPADLETTIQEVAKLGLRNHITEMDISLRAQWGLPGTPGVPAVTSELEKRQAAHWAELFRMFRRNKDKIDAVLTWGVNDETSWRGAGDKPLLFDHFRPTPAFWAVLAEATRDGPMVQPVDAPGVEPSPHR
jgi:endo-1,4-beta-xylanase